MNRPAGVLNSGTPPARPVAADWVLLLALTVMWGSAFALTKAAVAELAPATVVAGRLAVGAGLLLVWWRFGGRHWPRDRRLWLFFVLIALFGNIIPFNLIAWGQQHIDSSLAGLLMAVMPLFTLLLAHVAIPGERLTAARIGGFFVGLIGVTVLLGPDIRLDGSAAGPFLPATLAVLAGALCYALSTILSRLRPASDATTSAAATTAIGALVMLSTWRPGTGVAEVAVSSAGPLVAVAALGVFSTALAAVMYFRLIERVGPTFVSQLNYLIPVWAVLLGGVVFGERPAFTDYLAMAIILAGIALSQRSPGGEAGAPDRVAAQRSGG